MFDIARRALALLLLAREAMEPEVSPLPEDFAAFVRNDHAMYESIVKSSGANVE